MDLLHHQHQWPAPGPIGEEPGHLPLQPSLGFSLLAVDGLDVLSVPFTPEEREDDYHVRKVQGHLAGIQRPGLAEQAYAVPPTLDGAPAFYDVCHRHGSGATSFDGNWRERSLPANPDGVRVAEAHVGMIAHLLPRKCRPRFWSRLRSKVRPGAHVKVSEVFFATVIHQAYSEPITYTVPRTVEDLRDFVHEGMRSGSEA